MDAIDRTLLGLLQEDATRSYATLAKIVNLSTGATHDRVRKMRERGVIRRTTIEVDPVHLDQRVLAFVLVESEGWITDAIRASTVHDPRIEDLHTVAGEANFIIKARVSDTGDLQRLLRSLYDIPGVRRSRTLMVLDSYIDRPPGLGSTPLTPPPD